MTHSAFIHILQTKVRLFQTIFIEIFLSNPIVIDKTFYNTKELRDLKSPSKSCHESREVCPNYSKLTVRILSSLYRLFYILYSSQVFTCFFILFLLANMINFNVNIKLLVFFSFTVFLLCDFSDDIIA